MKITPFSLKLYCLNALGKRAEQIIYNNEMRHSSSFWHISDHIELAFYFLKKQFPAERHFNPDNSLAYKIKFFKRTEEAYKYFSINLNNEFLTYLEIKINNEFNRKWDRYYNKRILAGQILTITNLLPDFDEDLIYDEDLRRLILRRQTTEIYNFLINIINV